MRLQIFREVVARRSFSAAAAALDYTQSSVSQQVSNLERELGVSLLDRGARPVALTPAGEIVLRHAEDLLGRATWIERELAGLTAGDSGQLRMGGFFTAWATFLPGAVAAYSRARPRVGLELRQLEPEPALRALRAGDLDLAVTYHFDATDRDDDGLTWHHLLDDPYAVALPAGHDLVEKAAVSLRDLATERWVCPPADSDYTRLLRALCRQEAGFEPDIAYQTPDIAMAQPLVAAGLAVALMPELGLTPRHRGVVVRPLPAMPPARSVAVAHIAARRNPTARPMIDELTSAARRHAG